MNYIYLILLTISTVLANEELDDYLNNKNLQHNIVKDEKNQKIVINLLYTDESKIIVFDKNKSDGYKKTFDKKLYFCTNYKYSNIMVKLKNQKTVIVCAMPNVDNGYYLEFYSFENFSTLNSELLSIEKRYININDDTTKSKYIFSPKMYRPTLNDFTNKDFSDNYVLKNSKNFVKIDTIKKNILSERQPLYKTPPTKTKMYLIKGDKVEILEEKDDWLYILYKGKKEIKAWIPKSAVEEDLKEKQIEKTIPKIKGNTSKIESIKEEEKTFFTKVLELFGSSILNKNLAVIQS